MAKKRVHEIAKAQGLESKEVLAALKSAGIEAKAAASSVEEADALDARSLGVARRSPLLEIDRLALALDGNPVEWRLSRCNSAHHHYYSEIE